MAQSTTGIRKETAAALSYLFGPITGLLFLLLERDRFVRIHAIQSIVFTSAALVINTILRITIVFAPLMPIALAIEFVLWLTVIYQASQGIMWRIPFVGKFAEQSLKTE